MISRERYKKQPAAGFSSWNTHSILKGSLVHLSVNPSDTTTTYDVLLKDDANTTVYEQRGKKGVFVDDSKIGVYGIYTINLSNTSASNKTWTTTILWREDVRA